ncbi:MAG: hypothetical protein K2H06_00975, partial [Anaeroplasmataceae bacterium]|nr:hypothetical protein [Anaeroplasmataceae bacterium]
MKRKLKYVGVAFLSALVLAACTKKQTDVPPGPDPVREAVTYYVAPNGSLDADGLSETTPITFHTAIAK